MTPKAASTLKREARRIRAQMGEAYRVRDPAEDMLYGALVALEWAAGEDVMRPSAAFPVTESIRGTTP